MKFLRVLTMLCFSLGLFVQVAAQAAVPLNEPAEMAECAEMAQAMPEQSMDTHDISPDREGRCPDMTLECLLVMNCLPPLALSGTGTQDAAPLNLAPSYLATTVAWLESEPLLPESPPPQSNLTV